MNIITEDKYNHIINNISRIKNIDIENGIITTVRNSNGCLRNKDKNSYLHIKLNKKAVMVHHIIAICIFGKESIGMQVNHKNGIKTDNRKVNLELVSQKENARHAWDTGLFNSHINNIRKLTDEDVFNIKKDLYYTNKSYKELALEYNVSKRLIENIKNGSDWNHVKTEWDYHLINSNRKEKPKNYLRRLSNEDVLEIRKMIKDKVKTSIILDKFNISRGMFYDIKNYKTYKELYN